MFAGARVVALSLALLLAGCDAGTQVVPEPAATGVTMDKYNRLQTGMSYAQAVAILGSKGEEISSSDVAGYRTVMYSWNTSGGIGNMNAMFQNDKLIQKAQFGLE